MFDTAIGAITNQVNGKIKILDANIDTIKDFVSAAKAIANPNKPLDKDVIQLDIAVFTSLTSVSDDLAVVNKLSKTTAVDFLEADGKFLIYEQSTGKLLYDADGFGTGEEAIQFLTLTGKPTLAAADFDILGLA